MYKLARVIGHRGLAEVAPENTLAGLRAARAAGLTFVEVDILPTADGVAVLSHDDSLERRAGVAKKTTETEWTELANIPVGTGFPDFADEKIPTAAEALSFCAASGMGMVLELKPEGGKRGALALADAIAEARERGEIPERLMVSSFGFETLRHARELLPEIPRALNIWDMRLDWRDFVRETECANLHANWRATTPALSREVSSLGMGLYCYTVNSRGLYMFLRAIGASGVFTDSPKLAPLG